MKNNIKKENINLTHMVFRKTLCKNCPEGCKTIWYERETHTGSIVNSSIVMGTKT